MATRLAFSGDHLSPEDKRKQAQKCVNVLQLQQQKFTDAEIEFFTSISDNLDGSPKWVPTYKQLNWLKDLVEKYD